MINKLIHWKKQIDYSDSRGTIFANFNSSKTSFEELVKHIESECHFAPPVPELKEVMLSGKAKKGEKEIELKSKHKYYELVFERLSENQRNEYYELAIDEYLDSDGSYTLSLKSSFIENASIFIGALLSLDGFRSLVLLNDSVMKWDRIDKYKSYKYKSGLKVYKDAFGEKKVDISQRPGRTSLTCRNFTWYGSNEYWFGADFFVPLKRISKFDSAESIEEISNNIIYIKLFDLNEYWSKTSQEVLLKFRNHLQIDDLELEQVQYAKEYRKRKLNYRKKNIAKLHHYRNFGAKMMWVVIKGNNPSQVIKALNAKSVRISNWKESSLKIKNSTMVTNPIGGYILVIGGNLPTPDSKNLLTAVSLMTDKLSSEFGEVLYFAEHRVNSFVMWLKSINGKTIRAYAKSDSQLIDEGELTDIEKEIFTSIFEKGDSELAPLDIRELVRISSSWCGINPQAISEMKDVKEEVWQVDL